MSIPPSTQGDAETGVDAVAYDRIRGERDYAVRRIEALTGILAVIAQGFDYPPPRHSNRRVLTAPDMQVLADEALDPDYLSHDA